MRYPTDKDRLSIIGSTGSGKTQAALWHLSNRNYRDMPWIVYNFKNDESIDAIPYAKHIELDELPYKSDGTPAPGIYVAHPHPDDTMELAEQFTHIWERGNCGIYIDEGYMVGRHNRPFRAILTQGRSKRIPMIVLSQRPTWMDPFVFTESQFFQVFRLQWKKDIQNVESFVPGDLSKRLPEYHSYYYDVGENKLSKVSPVPEIGSILETFEKRLRNRTQAV